MADLVPFSSPWWLDRLGKRIDQRAADMAALDDYYNGIRSPRFGSPIMREKRDQIPSIWTSNFCKPVVQALEERLAVTGFRFGDDAGNRKAWRLWQANQMDAQSQKAHREAIIKGDCPIIVAPPSQRSGFPIIRVLKPEEVAIAYGDDPLERVVAMRRWKTADKRTLATLYFADRLEKYEYDSAQRSWLPRRVPDEEWPAEHDLGAVPIVPILNDPDLDNVGASEIRTVMPKQDILNKLWGDIIQASETAAFRQKWATGVEIPVDPETKLPVEAFQAAVNRIWSTVAPDAKFGDFEQTDMSQMIAALGEAIQEIAAETRTPYHYFLQHSGQPPSGESLKSAETGLVAKAKRRQRDIGEGWEEVERLGFRAMGDERRASMIDAETIWRDPETRTESEHVDALVKLASIGVPEEQLWSDAGYTPQQIEAFLVMRLRQPQVPVSTPKIQTMPETDTGAAPVDPPVVP